MDYATFRRANPATRCWQPYSHDTRAAMQASHRLGYRQRQSWGEFYYVHPMIPDRAFSTAKDATMAAYALVVPGIGHNGGPAL